jgi:hypothetical protein
MLIESVGCELKLNSPRKADLRIFRNVGARIYKTNSQPEELGAEVSVTGYPSSIEFSVEHGPYYSGLMLNWLFFSH